MAELYKYVGFRYSNNPQSPRFEGLPNFPVAGLSELLQDALTSIVCRKTPGSGTYQHINISPIFTFEVHNDHEEDIVLGADVVNFINNTIDTLIQIGISLEFQSTGQLMITLIGLEKVQITSNQIQMHLTVHYLKESLPFEEKPFNYTPEAAPYDLVCPLNSNPNIEYIPTSPASLLDFNWVLNNPNCNLKLRWRQRLHQDGNIVNNPPQPNQSPRAGFMWTLMYSGVQSSNANPNFTPSFYTQFSPRNMWSKPANLPPDTLKSWVMIDYINAINHRFRDENIYQWNANYWDPQNITVSTSTGVLFNQFCLAHSAWFYWSEWKWVMVPDYNFWANLPVTFETGITDFLNP